MNDLTLGMLNPCCISHLAQFESDTEMSTKSRICLMYSQSTLVMMAGEMLCEMEILNSCAPPVATFKLDKLILYVLQKEVTFIQCKQYSAVKENKCPKNT